MRKSKRILSLLLVCCFLVGVLPMSALAVTDSGGNDSAGTAQSLTLGDTISGQIAPEKDVDFYQFVLTESGRVTLDITSYMQYYSLYIYDTAGTELWSTDWNEYNSTVGFREDVHTIDLEAGVYYLKVTGYRYGTSYASTGNYTIQTAFTPSNANEAEPNNSAAEANSITLGSTIRGLIGVNDRYDFYQFSLTGSGRVTLDITSYMQYYSLYIYDTAGTELWSTDWNEYNSTVGFREDVHTIDLETGVFYLKVTGYRYGESYASTGNYTIQTAFTPSNANEAEPNNSAAEANSITLGNTLRGLIGANDRFDFYQFTMPQGGQLVLNITSYMQYYTLHIYDTAGTELWDTDWNEYNSTTGFREDSHTIDLESGTYYLKVTGYRYGTSYASTGTYTITFGEQAKTVAVTGVALFPTSVSLQEGESKSLTAVISPTDATNQSLTWTSSNRNIATVIIGGVVTAVRPGTAVITVTTEDGGFTAKCTVTVEEEQEKTVAVTGVSLSPTSVSLQEGESRSLTATVSPADATNQSLTWTSSNRNVAAVNSSGVVTAKKPGTAVITVTAEDGEFTAKCTVTVEEEDVGNGERFKDVPVSFWCYEAVEWAVGENITGGTSATTFSPNETCTRAQAVTFLWRAAGSPEPSSTVNPFRDVSSGKYYYKAVLWAVENGVTGGTSATTFSPNQTCTRAQIITFQWRAAGRPSASGSSFPDVPSGAYYRTAVAWAVRNGIASGMGDGTFGPNRPCTRAQIVTLLYRAEN